MPIFNRLRRQEQEQNTLSPYACLSQRATRQFEPELDEYRTAFERDRDRILHCKAFRRLMHKTQVFVAPESDHYRTRLTHTLEVAQISRSIARALQLNADLAEAIALSHDLGHTPFGHSGEDALQECLTAYSADMGIAEPLSFKHNEQSLRVVDVLENEGKGLNLTNEVRNGILCHTGKTRAYTLEGRIVALADRIAYVNHDIDDAMRAGLLQESDIPLSTHTMLGQSHSERITSLVNDTIANSIDKNDILMTEPMWQALLELRTYLTQNVYWRTQQDLEVPKVKELITQLFNYYLQHADEIPPDILAASTVDGQQNDVRAVVDYIALMTDRFATRTFEHMFVPQSWA